MPSFQTHSCAERRSDELKPLRSDADGSPSQLLFACVSSWHYLLHVIWLLLTAIRLFHFFASHPRLLEEFFQGDAQRETRERHQSALGFVLVAGLFVAPLAGLPMELLQRYLKRRTNMGLERVEAEVQAEVEAEAEVEMEAGERHHSDAGVGVGVPGPNGTADEHNKLCVGDSASNSSPTSASSVVRENASSRTLTPSQSVFAILPGVPSLLLSSLFAVLLSASLFWSASLYAAYVAALLLKSFLFGTANAYLLLAFPARHFGTLIGALYTVLGVGNFAFTFACKQLDAPLLNQNLVLLGVALLSLVHPVALLAEFGVSRLLSRRPVHICLHEHYSPRL